MSKLVGQGSKYTDGDRRRAVVEYCTNGVMARVSDITGIPDTTLSHWKNKSDWWDNLVAEVRNEINDKILAQNLEIATRAVRSRGRFTLQHIFITRFTPRTDFESWIVFAKGGSRIGDYGLSVLRGRLHSRDPWLTCFQHNI